MRPRQLKLEPTKVITLKTQTHAVNACSKRLSQLSFRFLKVQRNECFEIISKISLNFLFRLRSNILYFLKLLTHFVSLINCDILQVLMKTIVSTFSFPKSFRPHFQSMMKFKQLCEKIPAVNFINVKRAHFLYERHFGSFFLGTCMQ